MASTRRGRSDAFSSRVAVCQLWATTSCHQCDDDDTHGHFTAGKLRRGAVFYMRWTYEEVKLIHVSCPQTAPFRKRRKQGKRLGMSEGYTLPAPEIRHPTR